MPLNPDVQNLIRKGWDASSALYGEDRSGTFRQYSERLLDLLALPHGAVALDVGAGTGIVTRGAARRVGAEGRVVGADLSYHMLALAAHGRPPQTHFVQLNAEHLSFGPHTFDAVMCAFSLFQFGDMRRALDEMLRVLKAGGRIALSNWGPSNFSPVGRMQRDIFREAGLRALLSNPIKFEASTLETLLFEAGFADIDVLIEPEDVWFADSAALWEYNMAMGPFEMMLRQQLTPEQRESVRQQFEKVMNVSATSQGIKVTFEPMYALARKLG